MLASYGSIRYRIDRVMDEARQLVLVQRSTDGFCAILKRSWLKPIGYSEQDKKVFMPSSRSKRIRLEGDTVAWVSPANFQFVEGGQDEKDAD